MTRFTHRDNGKLMFFIVALVVMIFLSLFATENANKFFGFWHLASMSHVAYFHTCSIQKTHLSRSFQGKIF